MEPEYEVDLDKWVKIVDSLKPVDFPDLKDSISNWKVILKEQLLNLPETDLQRSFRKMALKFLDDESISDKDFRQLFRNAKQIGAI